jgi:hypothetical protein
VHLLPEPERIVFLKISATSGCFGQNLMIQIRTLLVDQPVQCAELEMVDSDHLTLCGILRRQHVERG